MLKSFPVNPVMTGSHKSDLNVGTGELDPRRDSLGELGYQSINQRVNH